MLGAQQLLTEFEQLTGDPLGLLELSLLAEHRRGFASSSACLGARGQHLLMELKHLPVQNLGRLVLALRALLAARPPKVAHAPQRVRVLGAQHLLTELDHLPEQLFSRLVPTLLAERPGKIAHAVQRLSVLEPQQLLTELKHFPVRSTNFRPPCTCPACEAPTQGCACSSRVWVLEAQHILKVLEHLLVHLLARIVLAQLAEHLRQVLNTPQRVRVLGAQHLLAELEHLPAHLFGCPVLALLGEHAPKCTHAMQRVRVLEAQHLVTEHDHLPVHLFGCLVVALLNEHPRAVVHARQNVRLQGGLFVIRLGRWRRNYRRDLIRIET